MSRKAPAYSPITVNAEAPRPLRSVLGKYLGRFFVLTLSLFGLIALWGAWDQTRMARLPLRPLAPLTEPANLAAGEAFLSPVEDGDVVRVEGLLRAEAPLRARAGHSIALQQLHVSELRRQSVGTRTSSTRLTQALRPQSSRLWLYVSQASAQRVEVRLPELWDGRQILLEPVSGDVGDAGTIPNNIAPELSQALSAPSPFSTQRWELWSIRQDARVSVVARARIEAGRTVLEIRPGLGSVLSPAPWSQITSGARREGVGQAVLGLVCLLPLAWVIAERIAQKRSGWHRATRPQEKP